MPGLARRHAGLAPAAAATLLALGRLGAQVAQWDLNGALGSSTGGMALSMGHAVPATTPGLAWRSSPLGGLSTRHAEVSRGTWLAATHGLGSNGGGRRLNRYSLLLDVLLPARPAGWAALLQTSESNADDADWFVDPSGRLGISGQYGGRVPDAAWCRLALVVDATEGTWRAYVNGSPAQQGSGVAIDGRFSLGPRFLVLADNDAENAPAWVNAIQLRPEPLSPQQVLALGGPSAAGIPTIVPAPVNPLFGSPLQANGGFESAWSGWSIQQGRPVAQSSGFSKGASRSGSRFFHGGVARPGDAVASQVIPLDGFSSNELASAVVEAEGWLRGWHPAGAFDDQVHFRVGFLDAGGTEVASARSLIAGDATWLLRPVRAALPPGTRALRLEVVSRHRRDADNDGMADDLLVRLLPAPAPTPPVLTKLPMLQGVRPDAMTLLWETDHPDAVPSVEWGRSNVTERTTWRVETLQVDAARHVHRATIGGLEPGTSYVYRVRNGPTASPTFPFRTAPRPDEPFVTAWWGDNHGGTATLRRHVANILRHGPDLLCVAGDMVNSGNVAQEWHDFWFKPLEHLNAAQSVPVVFARGNHDGEHALAYAYSALPGNESWFAFDFGNTRFLFLDSEADASVAPEQRAWLAAELASPASRNAAFRVACFHKPPWSNFWNGGGHAQEPFVINEWVPLLQRGHVDLVVCGHEHAYTRGHTNGVTYVVSGGGGGTLDTERVARWPHIQVEHTRLHYDVMAVHGRTLSWQAFDDSNQLLDEFSLVSRVPEVRISPAHAGGHLLAIEGRPGLRYRIESADVVGAMDGSWTVEGEVVASTRAVSWTLDGTGASRFVRVVTAP